MEPYKCIDSKDFKKKNLWINFGGILRLLFYNIPSDLYNLCVTSKSMYNLMKQKSLRLIDKDDNNKWLKNLVKYINIANTKRKIASYGICSYISLYYNNDTKQERCILIRKKKKGFNLYIQNHGKLKVKYSKAIITTSLYIPSKKILRLSDDFKYERCSGNISRHPSRQCKICKQ
jgi:hypothetical protein